MCHDWQQVTCLRDGTSNIFMPSLPFHMLAERRQGFTLGHTSLITQRNITLQRINSNKPSSQSLICTHSIMNHRLQKKHGLRRHGSAEAIYSTWGVICRGAEVRQPSIQTTGEGEGERRHRRMGVDGFGGGGSNLFRGISWGAIRCRSASHPPRRTHSNRWERL